VLGPTCIGINLAIKVGLQGARVGVLATDTLMRATLRSYGGANGERFIPTEEPYEDMNNFAHAGGGDGGGEVIVDSNTVFAVTNNDAIVDWVYVELRSSTNLDSVGNTRAGLLQRDGDVVDMDGVSPLSFPNAQAGAFYVAVRHRNHLGVMSGTAIDLSPIVQEVDFMDPLFVPSGIHAQVKIAGKWYMWGGDFNFDGRTIYQGPGNDILKLFTTVLYDTNNDTQIANFISEGYFTGDFNLDGRAIYQGPANDRSMLLLNATLSHPANVGLISNYVILEQLP
jgi:large repetitive protein